MGKLAKLDQNIFAKNYPSKDCTVYPNGAFESNNDSDKAFISETLEKNFGAGIVPIWATDDWSKVSTGNITGWNDELYPP